MTTLEKLHAPELAIEDAAKTALAGVGCKVVSAREALLVSPPVIHVICKLGQATGQRAITSSGLFWSGYEATLNFLIVTLRERGSRETHAKLVARVRLAMQRAEQKMLMQNFALAELRPNGDEYAIDEETNQDQTTLTFACIVGVKPSAWPT